MNGEVLEVKRHWERVVIERFEDKMPDDEKFVKQVNGVTADSFGKSVPLEETYKHLENADLGNFVYIENGRDRRMVAYMLNEFFTVTVRKASPSKNEIKKVNYISSAFIVPNVRQKMSVLRFLGSISMNWDEDVFMIRTQNPMIMSFFSWLSEFCGMQLFTQLDVRAGEDIPHICWLVTWEKFLRRSLQFDKVYGRLLTAEVIEPRTSFTKKMMDLIDPYNGDALILISVKM